MKTANQFQFPIIPQSFPKNKRHHFAHLFAYLFGIFHNYTAKKQFMQVLINFY